MSEEESRSPDWREWRRYRAAELHEEGWTGQEIAVALGVSTGAVSQWLKRLREGGREALRAQPPPGPTPRLTPEQQASLPELLAWGAEAYGFLGDVWTTKRVALVIEQEYGVRYHPDHVGRLLRAAGWSVQKPVTRATQRDEAAITAWCEERWPEVKKKGGNRGADPGVGG
jgi:transposase